MWINSWFAEFDSSQTLHHFLDLPKSNLVSPSWTCSTQVWLTISRESNSVSQKLDSLNLTSTEHVSKYVYVFIFCICWVFPNLFLTRFKFNSFASMSVCQFQARWLWCRLLKKQLPKQKIKSIQQNFTNRVRHMTSSATYENIRGKYNFWNRYSMGKKKILKCPYTTQCTTLNDKSSEKSHVQSCSNTYLMVQLMEVQTNQIDRSNFSPSPPYFPSNIEMLCTNDVVWHKLQNWKI